MTSSACYETLSRRRWPAAAWRDVAADLAERAGDTERTGALLAASAEAALDRGHDLSRDHILSELQPA